MCPGKKFGEEEVAHQLNKMSTDELSMWEQMQALQDKVNEHGG